MGYGGDGGEYAISTGVSLTQFNALKTGVEQRGANVKDFGAIGDGTTDDTTAIQTAINAKGLIYFPKGEYKITASLTIPDTLAIKGAGVGITNIKIGGNFSAFKLADPTTSVYNVSIEDLTITGTSTGASQNGIDMSGMSRAVIRNVSIWNCAGAGIVAVGETDKDSVSTGNAICYYNWLYNVHVYGCGWGLYATSTINDWTWISGSVSTCTYGISLEVCTNCHFIGVSLETMTNDCLHISYTHYCSFIGLRGETAVNGIYETVTCTNNYFIGCHMISCTNNINSSSPSSIYLNNGSIFLQPDWTNCSFLNSWENEGSGQNAGYWKDALGIVHLRGLIKSGSLHAACFQLPEGYRPSTLIYFSVASGTDYAQAYVSSNGNVVPEAGSTEWFSLEGITFRAEQ